MEPNSFNGNEKKKKKKKLPPPPKRVLLVEDDPGFLEIVLEFIKAFDSQLVVKTATDGNIALNAMTQDRYHILITDLSMPNINGQNLVQSLKFLKETLAPKFVLVISGFVTIPYCEKNTTSYVTYFPKPLDRKEFNSFLSDTLKSIL